jgi:xanthine dehydrogenase accessory factor
MEIWQNILNKLNEDNIVMLLFVASHKGSSPGKQGFKMMVADDGFIYGSIGGGITEFNMVEKAKVLLQDTEAKPIFANQVHRTNETASSGMICSGEQLVCLYPINREFIPILERIIAHQKGVLTITPSVIELISNKALEDDIIFKNSNDDSWEYKENINRASQLFIIGGGHVGLATSRLFEMLDFEVTMLDCRVSLNTMVENKYSDHIQIVDYKNIDLHIPQGKQIYIVIMTHKFEDDKLIISNLMKRRFKYLGLLGSKTKIKILRKKLVNEGILVSDFDKIDAPIGIPINSKTPAEIAVSIAAKIISIKNQ